MMTRETILCVDDEEGVLLALRQQLAARFGHECDIATASSGADALELLDELERDGEKIAVVIADQIMPGMKGVDLLEVVDRRSPTTTKILLTGQAGLGAALVPAPSAALYFVSRGDGTSYFSETLEEHNRAVRKYQLKH